MAKLANAFDLGSEYCGFESLSPHHQPMEYPKYFVSEKLKQAGMLKLRAVERRYYPYKLFAKLKIWRFARAYAIWDIRNILYEIEEEEEGDIKDLNGLIMYANGIFLLPTLMVLAVPISLFIIFFPFLVSDFIYDFGEFCLDFPNLGALFASLIAMIGLVVIPNKETEMLKIWSAWCQVVIVGFLLLLLTGFDLSDLDFQYQTRLLAYYRYKFFLYSASFGVDSLSLLLGLLTTYLFFVGMLFNWHSISKFIKELNICLHMLQFFILGALFSTDIIVFYFSFEATLIPLLLLIGIWGSRVQKVAAAYRLFFYTLVTSSVTLIGILLLLKVLPESVGDFAYLENVCFTPALQKVLYLLFFISFAVKLPIVPVHSWLPEAHVEAPTVISIILAGILLKLGSYGMYRFLIPLFYDASCYFSSFVTFLGLLSIFYSAIVSICYSDFKKIIAYSSIAHMGFITISLANVSAASTVGAIYNMVSHGLISGALFAVIGVLYDRYKTRALFYYKGLATTMPLFTTWFLLAILANIAFPGLSSFISEFITLIGIFSVSPLIAMVMMFSVVLNAVVGLWLYNRVSFGNLNLVQKFVPIYQDITEFEFLAISLLVVPTIIFGVFPGVLIDTVDLYSEQLSELVEAKLKY